MVSRPMPAAQPAPNTQSWNGESRCNLVAQNDRFDSLIQQAGYKDPASKFNTVEYDPKANSVTITGTDGPDDVHFQEVSSGPSETSLVVTLNGKDYPLSGDVMKNGFVHVNTGPGNDMVTYLSSELLGPTRWGDGQAQMCIDLGPDGTNHANVPPAKSVTLFGGEGRDTVVGAPGGRFFLGGGPDEYDNSAASRLTDAPPSQVWGGEGPDVVVEPAHGKRAQFADFDAREGDQVVSASSLKPRFKGPFDFGLHFDPK